MKQYMKKELLAMIGTMQQANDSILGNRTSDPAGVTNMLIQCQESAVLVGNQIEALGAEYMQAVHLLEDYCETVYQISNVLQTEAVCRKLVKKATKELTALSNMIRYDFPNDRREILFLPYKAAMWDSLESVWEAAERDPDCDAYVMPIPYYDKNPDGSFGELHDESKDYPKYVPILDWKEHDIASWKPDVIYIHNPYDQYNYVTSVHPDFYAKRLRELTGSLVYIPYFIHQNDDVKALYCALPGILYADTVVLQSEKVRQRYIEEYCKTLRVKSVTKQIERKFAAYGSPKFDAQDRNVRMEDLPEDWRRMIWENGEKKPVVFFNTHLTMLMQAYSDAFFRKLETVFDVFRRNRNLVLLWRPHPLSDATAESMNPEAAGRYRDLISEYQKDGIGIYDTSPDLHRAVDVSDAYYGSRSSVIELFKAEGKPVMIMNHRI